MSLYSQTVSNNPLSLDGLITGNFDLLYVDGQPVTPTDTSGLVPYTGATATVNLNSQKITTTYVPVNDEDLTNKLYNEGRYLKISGFNVSSGNFIFNTGSTVQLNGTTYVNCSVAAFVGVLCLDSANKIVLKSTSVIGDVNLGASQTFIGYNTFSLPLTTNGISNTGDISTTGLLTCSNLDITGSSIATPTYALGINGSNQVVRFAGGTGDAVLSAGTLGLPQQFTGYNYFGNLLKLNGSIQFTSPVTAGTATYILGVDSSTGNLVSTAPTSAPTQLTITNTAVSNTYYPTWITSTSTGVKTIYGVNGVSYDLPANILTATKLKLGMPLPTGTTSSLLAVDSTGNVISGATAGDAYLANTQTFTGINTFNNNVIVPSGAILFAHYLYASTTLLQITAQYGITANLPSGDFVVGLNSTSGLSIAGDHTLGVFAVDTLRIGYQTFPKLRFWNASTYIEWVTNSQGCDFKNATDTTFSYDQTGIFMYKPTAMTMGGWLPTNGATSLYITDTFPSTASTTYGRYFGVAGAIYQDFYNTFNWRRDATLTGSGVVDIMTLNANGLTLQNAVALGQPQLTFAGSGVPTIKATGNGINWSMNGSNSGYFDMNAWAAGYGWRINANQFMTMQCAYDMVIKCKVGGVPQYGANNRYIQIVTPNSVNDINDFGGNGWYSGACVFRAVENNGNLGGGIGISMSSSPTYGGNNYGYIACVEPGTAWRNLVVGGSVGYWYVNGTACAYINSTAGWQAASDERCKRDIQDLNTKKSLQRVLKCKPKHYKRILREPKGDNPIPLKQEDIDRVHVGLIAQEVLEYNPHCVSTWEDDTEEGGKVERLGLAYQDFIIHLIGSVQEQQKQIDTLKNKVEKQEETINTLLDHVKRLTEQVNQITLKLK